MVKNKKLKSLNVVDYLIMAFFIVFVLISLVPLLNILSLSISDNYSAIHNKGMLFPDFKHTSFNAYKAIFNSSAIYTSFLMSILITVVTTLVHIAVTICAGYVLSIKRLPGRNALLLFVLFTMLFISLFLVLIKSKIISLLSTILTIPRAIAK